MKHLLLSHSARMFWNQCHRKFYWSSIEQLEPKMIPEAFQRGKIGHMTLDVVTTGKAKWQDVVEEVRTADIMFADALAYYFKREEAGSVADLTKLEYVRHAVPFRLPLGTIVVGDEQFVIEYVGELDGIVAWQSKNWVLENKFTKQIPSDLVGRFQLDDQTRGYKWASDRLNLNTAGALVNIVRATKYPEVVREPILMSTAETDAFYVDVMQVAEEICEAIVKHRFPMSPHTCNLMGECPYKLLCVNPDRAQFAETMGYTKRELSHEEEVSVRAALDSILT